MSPLGMVILGSSSKKAMLQIANSEGLYLPKIKHFAVLQDILF